jgi:cytochrome c551/c552
MRLLNRRLSWAILVLGILGRASLHGQAGSAELGKALFTQQCAACHSLAQDGIGPPLGGVTDILSESQMLQWIKNPEKVLAAGDARATALLLRYKAPMPAFTAMDSTQVNAIRAFISQQSVVLHLVPLAVGLKGPPPARHWFLPVQKTSLSVEVEDYVEIPRLPNRTPYKGITLLRPDPREEGALFICDLMGVIYRVRDRKVSVFLDMRGMFPDFVWDPGVATGLGSLALDPAFARNGRFYTTHAERFRGTPAINSSDIPADVPPGLTPPLEWVLTEWQLADTASPAFAGTHREVLRFVTPTTAHASQEIAFAPVTDPHDPDYGLLYVGIGDGGSVNLKRPDMAGHPRTLLGSIIRIDPLGHDGANGRYGIPSDNPFARGRDPAVRKEIWAYGFRNPHRMSWDLAYGRRMIAVDIGESNAEEVNLIERGGAYGWGVGLLEGTLHIDAATDAKAVRPATAAELAPYHAPFGEYDHTDGAAITGGYVYRGPLAALRGKYIFGDIVTGRLLYMNMGADLSDHTIYELNIVRGGAVTGVKELGHLDRAHLRIGYDDRTGDLFLMTKGDGMVRRITAAYQR